MKLNLTLFIVFLGIFIASCDSNAPENVVLLRTDSFSGWVFISDKQGRLLDLQKTSEGEELLEFEGVADDWVIVTEVTVASFEFNGATNLQHYITSYVGVPVGGTYMVPERDPGKTTYPDTLGRASLVLNNYSESSDPLSTIGFSDSYNGYNNWLDHSTVSYDGSTFTADMILRESPIDIFVSAYDGPDPVYTWMRDVEVGDDIVIDFDSFSPLKRVSINKPVNNAYIQGQIEPELGGRGYELSRSEYRMMSDDYDPSETITVGYVDGFEYYDTYAQRGPIYCCQPHERVSYHKLGSSVPESIELPDFEFSLINENLFDLDYTFNRPYTYKFFYFAEQDDNNTFNWFIRVPEGTELVVPNLPAEIIALFPFLNREELPLKTVGFTEYLDGYSYDDFIRDRFERQPGRVNFENLEYGIQF